jgi:uncharacterized membrane protein YkvA (DUF1232 family)
LSKISDVARPYVQQFKRSPLWVKAIAILCVLWLTMPIDPWDILFPWLAFHDDIFVATILLKLLHKYGSLPDEDKTTPKDIVNKLVRKKHKH